MATEGSSGPPHAAVADHLPPPTPLLKSARFYGTALLVLSVVSMFSRGPGLLGIAYCAVLLYMVRGIPLGRKRSIRCVRCLSVCGAIGAVASLLFFCVALFPLIDCACRADCVSTVYDKVQEHRAYMLAHQDEVLAGFRNATGKSPGDFLPPPSSSSTGRTLSLTRGESAAFTAAAPPPPSLTARLMHWAVRSRALDAILPLPLLPPPPPPPHPGPPGPFPGPHHGLPGEEDWEQAEGEEDGYEPLPPPHGAPGFAPPGFAVGEPAPGQPMPFPHPPPPTAGHPWFGPAGGKPHKGGKKGYGGRLGRAHHIPGTGLTRPAPLPMPPTPVPAEGEGQEMPEDRPHILPFPYPMPMPAPVEGEGQDVPMHPVPMPQPIPAADTEGECGPAGTALAGSCSGPAAQDYSMPAPLPGVQSDVGGDVQSDVGGDVQSDVGGDVVVARAVPVPAPAVTMPRALPALDEDGEDEGEDEKGERHGHPGKPEGGSRTGTGAGSSSDDKHRPGDRSDPRYWEQRLQGDGKKAGSGSDKGNKHGSGGKDGRRERERDDDPGIALAVELSSKWGNITREEFSERAEHFCDVSTPVSILAFLYTLASLVFYVKAAKAFSALASHPWVEQQDRLRKVWQAARAHARSLGMPPPPPPPGLVTMRDVRGGLLAGGIGTDHPASPFNTMPQALPGGAGSAPVPQAVPVALPVGAGGAGGAAAEPLFRFVPGVGFVAVSAAPAAAPNPTPAGSGGEGGGQGQGQGEGGSAVRQPYTDAPASPAAAPSPSAGAAAGHSAASSSTNPLSQGPSPSADAAPPAGYFYPGPAAAPYTVPHSYPHGYGPGPAQGQGQGQGYPAPAQGQGQGQQGAGSYAPGYVYPGYLGYPGYTSGAGYAAGTGGAGGYTAAYDYEDGWDLGLGSLGLGSLFGRNNSGNRGASAPRMSGSEGTGHGSAGPVQGQAQAQGHPQAHNYPVPGQGPRLGETFRGAFRGVNGAVSAVSDVVSEASRRAFTARRGYAPVVTSADLDDGSSPSPNRPAVQYHETGMGMVRGQAPSLGGGPTAPPPPPPAAGSAAAYGGGGHY